MLMVTLSTVFKTLMVCVFLSISKGWFITKTNLSQNALSVVTLAMGGVYMCYSAFYVSANAMNIRDIVLVCIDILYLTTLVVFVKFTLETETIVNMQA